MSVGRPFICAACDRFRSFDRDHPTAWCAAFPLGIPDEILVGGYDHRTPLPAQGNDVVFELRPGADRLLAAYERSHQKAQEAADGAGRGLEAKDAIAGRLEAQEALLEGLSAKRLGIRHVRTPEGVQEYHAPIGTPIVPGQGGHPGARRHPGMSSIVRPDGSGELMGLTESGQYGETLFHHFACHDMAKALGTLGCVQVSSGTAHGAHNTPIDLIVGDPTKPHEHWQTELKTVAWDTEWKVKSKAEEIERKQAERDRTQGNALTALMVLHPDGLGADVYYRAGPEFSQFRAQKAGPDFVLHWTKQQAIEAWQETAKTLPHKQPIHPGMLTGIGPGVKAEPAVEADGNGTPVEPGDWVLELDGGHLVFRQVEAAQVKLVDLLAMDRLGEWAEANGFETKRAVRRVRTPEGAAKFKQPVGSPIIPRPSDPSFHDFRRGTPEYDAALQREYENLGKPDEAEEWASDKREAFGDWQETFSGREHIADALASQRRGDYPVARESWDGDMPPKPRDLDPDWEPATYAWEAAVIDRAERTESQTFQGPLYRGMALEPAAAEKIRPGDVLDLDLPQSFTQRPEQATEYAARAQQRMSGHTALVVLDVEGGAKGLDVEATFPEVISEGKFRVTAVDVTPGWPTALSRQVTRVKVKQESFVPEEAKAEPAVHRMAELDAAWNLPLTPTADENEAKDAFSGFRGAPVRHRPRASVPKVRTEAGVRKYGLPIGTPLTPDNLMKGRKKLRKMRGVYRYGEQYDPRSLMHTLDKAHTVDVPHDQWGWGRPVVAGGRVVPKEYGWFHDSDATTQLVEKVRQGKEPASALADLVVKANSQSGHGLPDVVVSMPFSLANRQGRDPLAPLRRAVSAKLEADYHVKGLDGGEVLRQVRGLPGYGDLPWEDRSAEQMNDAFEVVDPDKVKGRTVLLVDDVIESGETARIVRQKLLEAGAKEVNVAAAAEMVRPGLAVPDPDFGAGGYAGPPDPEDEEIFRGLPKDERRAIALRTYERTRWGGQADQAWDAEMDRVRKEKGLPARKWTIAHALRSEADRKIFAGFSDHVRTETDFAFQSLHHDYPKIRMPRVRMWEHAWATTSNEGTEITLNHVAWNGLDKAYPPTARPGWDRFHPQIQDAGGVEAVIDHEFGHVISRQALGWFGGPAQTDLLQRAWEEYDARGRQARHEESLRILKLRDQVTRLINANADTKPHRLDNGWTVEKVRDPLGNVRRSADSFFVVTDPDGKERTIRGGQAAYGFALGLTDEHGFQLREQQRARDYQAFIRSISSYALTNAQEALAEAFEDYRLGRPPTEASAIIGRMMQEAYDAWDGGEQPLPREWWLEPVIAPREAEARRLMAERPKGMEGPDGVAGTAHELPNGSVVRFSGHQGPSMAEPKGVDIYSVELPESAVPGSWANPKVVAGLENAYLYATGARDPLGGKDPKDLPFGTVAA